MKTSMTATAELISSAQEAVYRTTTAGLENAFQRGRWGMRDIPPL